MKIRSDILTTEDIFRELGRVDGVYADEWREFKPRKFKRGWEIFLEGVASRHKRERSSRPGKAATWIDYGVWMDALYAIDPGAEIAWYKSRSDFYEKTRRYPSGNKLEDIPWLRGQ